MPFCWHNRNEWVAYVMGEVSEAAQRRLEERLSRCSACRQEHQRLVALMGSLHKDAEQTLDPSGGEAFVMALRQNIEARESKRRSWEFGVPWPGWASAALVASLLVVGILWTVSVRPRQMLPAISMRQIKSPTAIRSPRHLSFSMPGTKIPEGSLRLVSISIPSIPSARRLGLGPKPRQGQAHSQKGSDSV
jgi:anti-sigma factor RsiW